MSRFFVVFATILPFVPWPQSAPVFRVDVNLVTLPCVVTDSRGATVADLKPDEFRVFDNGVPQKIMNVWRDGDLPLTAGVIIDASASQRAFVQEHHATVARFLERIIRLRDRAFVVRVNDKIVLSDEYVGRPDGLHQVMLPNMAAALGEPCPTLQGRSLCGGTALWEAVFSSARLKLREPKGSKALVILSDGNDTGSIHGFNAALQEVQRANTIVYAILYPDSARNTAGSESLYRLSSDTGGMQFDQPRGKLDAVLSRVEADLRNQYVLGFNADSAKSGRTHELRVEVTRPGLTVRTRREYVDSQD